MVPGLLRALAVMAAWPHAPERVRTVAYRDGLGERVIAADAVTAGVVQVLQLSPALFGSRMFEFALRERVLRLGKFRHAAYLPAHRVDRLQNGSQGLALVSSHVQGIRLSQLLQTACERRVPVDITTALEVVRQLLPPLALLHEFTPDIATGMIGPERLIVSSAGQITIAEQTLGGAIEQLRFDAGRLWRELRIAVPPATEPARFSQRGDVMGLGLVALALVLGRPLAEQDFPDGLPRLLDSARERSMIGGERPLSAPLRDWLARALQLDAARAFPSIAEAWAVFSKILTTDAAYRTAPVALDALLYNCTVALLQPAPEETEIQPAAGPVDPLPAQRPAAPDAAQDPEIRVEMLPPPSVDGHVGPPAATGDEIDWTAASEQLTAVASSHDISELLANVDDEATRNDGPQSPWPRASVFDELDEVTDTIAADVGPAGEAPLDVQPGAWLSRLSGRVASLTPSPMLSRTVMATALVTVLAVSVVWASFRAPALGSPEPGTLVVQTSPPGLQVLVDGVEQGQSPARVRVSPGDHVLEVRGTAGARVVPVTVSGGAEISQYIEFPSTPQYADVPLPAERVAAPGTPAAVAESPSVPLKSEAPPPNPSAGGSVADVPTWGWLAVKGPFPLEITTGGKVVSAAGVERIRMAAGRHEIELSNNAQAYRVSRVVQVMPGKVTNLTVEAAATGTLNLNASPWAEVWIGGRRIGETPLANVTVPAGRHQVVFRHPELGEKRQEISVTPGAAVRLAIEMK